MTIAEYNRITAALVAQRKAVTSSREAAAKLIDDLGIRDLLIDIPASKPVSSKTSAKKKTKKK